MHPNGSFTVEELKEAALVMSAKLADPLFISCIFETLLNLIERVPNPIPNASELCLYALNKVAFNVSRFIDPPPTLFPLIEAIIKREPTVGPPVFERLKVLHSRFSPFRSSPIVDNKNNTYNYRKGLSNLGCTCYINASLQQLLRVPEVRDAILSYRPSGDINTDWLAQLQLLFAKLLYFPCKSINPSPFIRNFKTPDGRPINVSEQQDAVEFVQFVMASIDEKIPTKPIEHTMNGKIVHEIVSLDPEKEYKGITEENFSTFALEVRDITDIQESFKIFKIPDLFTGKNQYNADNIGLIDAERRHAVREAPDTLVFQLKRFDFDMNTFARIKLNSQFKFPLTLDISPILENPETCEYELQGIIMHSGSSEGGHYYSYIKDSDGWFLYNDSRVSQIEESTVMANATVTPKGNIFTQALSFSNRNASGYLLFYRKKLPSKPPVDPICRMPAKMISYLLEDMQALVFRNVIFSEEYQRFLRTAIANASCTETYEMAFAFHDIILSSNDGMKFLDPLVRVMLKKAMTDKGFADYVLCKSSAFQNIIAQPSSKVRSIYTNLAVCAISISDFAEQFVNQLVPCLDCAYDRMMFLDSIFRPIVAFIERDPKPMPDLLLKLMSIVTDQFGRLDSKIQKSVTTNSDLSGCFRAVRLLLERDKENAALLQQIIMNDEFKNDWSISDKHAFEFSNLLYTYLRDNEELTLQHINYVEKNMNRYHVTWFASHFAAACVVDDSLVKKRLDFFFKAASESKNISEIVPFFCQKICSTNSLTACKPLIQYRDYWVAKWISSSNKSVREWTSKIIFSLFPMFPVLERIPMEFGVIKEPLPEEKSDPVYVALVAELWEALMNANKQVIMSANSANNADIAVNYFNVLSWATFYSCKYQVVDRLYVAFEKNIEILSKLKRKDGIFSLLCFMRAYINNPFAFFSLPTLKAYLNALSRISSKNPDLIRKAMNIFLPMIDCIAGDYSNVIVSSSFMCDAIPLCFEGESLPQMTEFIKLVTTEESIESLCSILFKKINFQKALWQCNDAYLDAVERCLDFPRGVDLFIKSGAPVAIIEFVEDHATKKIYMQQIHGITLLIKTTQNVIENKKYVKKFFGDPLSPIIDVWMVSGDFMKLVFQEIQDSSCPLQLSAKIAELLTIVFGSLHKFTSAGINLIAASENDVYSLLEPSIRLIIAKLRTTLITRYSLQKKDSSSLLICDMEKMISVYLYDSFVFTVYANSILSCNVKFPSSRICNILKSFFTGTSDLLVFDSPISMLLSMCSNEIKAEDEDVMAKRCYDLVAQLCCEGEEFKEISSTEKVGEIISKLKAAVSFLKNLRSTCGRAPEIKGGQRILSVFCSNKDIMEMIQFIGSFGID